MVVLGLDCHPHRRPGWGADKPKLSATLFQPEVSACDSIFLSQRYDFPQY